MAVGPLALRTKPSIFPRSHWVIMSFHCWLGLPSGWQVLAMWNMRTGLPSASGFDSVGLPALSSVRPSPRSSTPK